MLPCKRQMLHTNSQDPVLFDWYGAVRDPPRYAPYHDNDQYTFPRIYPDDYHTEIYRPATPRLVLFLELQGRVANMKTARHAKELIFEFYTQSPINRLRPTNAAFLYRLLYQKATKIYSNFHFGRLDVEELEKDESLNSFDDFEALQDWLQVAYPNYREEMYRLWQELPAKPIQLPIALNTALEPIDLSMNCDFFSSFGSVLGLPSPPSDGGGGADDIDSDATESGTE